MSRKPRKRTILARGWRKRCPRCGIGPILERWTVVAERCSSCGLQFEPSPGATWAFWIVGDRVFVVAAMLPIYLGLSMSDARLRAVLFGAVVVAFVATMPNRQGLAIALDYLTRVYWGDPVESSSPAESEVE